MKHFSVILIDPVAVETPNHPLYHQYHIYQHPTTIIIHCVEVMRMYYVVISPPRNVKKTPLLLLATYLQSEEKTPYLENVLRPIIG